MVGAKGKPGDGAAGNLAVAKRQGALGVSGDGGTTAIGLFADKTDNPIVRYTVGDVEPDQLRQYAWRSDKDEIATIPIYQVENIMQLIAAVRGATAPRKTGAGRRT